MDGWKRFVFGAKNKSAGGKFGALSEANGLEADDRVGLYCRSSLPAMCTSQLTYPKTLVQHDHDAGGVGASLTSRK